MTDFERDIDHSKTREPNWIGVDLDGTLARYDGWVHPEVIGDPIPSMKALVEEWLAAGIEVRIFTARVSKTAGSLAPICRKAIEDWTVKHFGRKLEVTCEKDELMISLWDDRAVGVANNEGYSRELMMLSSHSGLINELSNILRDASDSASEIKGALAAVLIKGIQEHLNFVSAAQERARGAS